MQGPTTDPWVFAGGRVNWISLVGVDVGYSISIAIHCETIKLTVCSDLGYARIPCNELCKAIEKAMR